METTPKITEAEIAKLKMARPLGHAIKIFRGRRRMTQQAMESMYPSLTQSYISKVESGDLFPSDMHLALIVRALEVTYSQLWQLAESIAESQSSEVTFEDCYKALNAKLTESTRASFDNLNEVLRSGHVSQRELDNLKSLLVGIANQPVESLPAYSKEMAVIAMNACRVLCERQETNRLKSARLREFTEDIGALAYAACETLCHAG